MAGCIRQGAAGMARPMTALQQPMQHLLQRYWPAQWSTCLHTVACPSPTTRHNPLNMVGLATSAVSGAASQAQGGETYKLRVGHEELPATKGAKLRLDAYLAARLSAGHAASRAKVQAAIKAGHVTINGQACDKPSQALVRGDCVVCTLLPGPSLEALPEAIPLDIVYEDDHLMVINKPAGMPVHISPGHHTGTLVNALLAHCGLPGVRIDPAYPSNLPGPAANGSGGGGAGGGGAGGLSLEALGTLGGASLQGRGAGAGTGTGTGTGAQAGMAEGVETGLLSGWVVGDSEVDGSDEDDEKSEEEEGNDGQFELSVTGVTRAAGGQQGGGVSGPEVVVVGGGSSRGSEAGRSRGGGASGGGGAGGGGASAGRGVLRPGIVHRLDLGTSGLLVVAKREAAQRGLSAQFKARTVGRIYESLTVGCPSVPSGRVMTNIDRDPGDRKRMAALAYGSSRGRTAASNYEVLERLVGGAAARVQWRLDTGRTHQIRVHAKHVGHPLLADVVYGGGATTAAAAISRGKPSLLSPVRTALESFNRPALHARTLAFDHPVTGQRLSFECDLPPDMLQLLEVLRGL